MARGGKLEARFVYFVHLMRALITYFRRVPWQIHLELDEWVKLRKENKMTALSVDDLED
jgi:hypothetical protein